MRTPLWLILLFLLTLSGPAGAELLQYRYLDTNGQHQEQPAAQPYGNPAGPIAVALSGGLDRKVQVELWRNNQRLAVATSAVLASTDRITVAGQDYYGAWLTLARPADGDYQVKALILDPADQTVQQDSYRWVVDTTAPMLGAFQYVGTAGYGSLEIFGDVFTNAIVVDKVSDANGIARVEAETVYLEGSQAGQVAARGAADYDETRNQISILKPMSQWYPVQRLRYRLTFVVYDRAGNRSAASLEHRYGSTCGELPEPVAAHRPGSTEPFLGQAVFAGFEPWSNGGMLYENPVTLVWRLPRHNWRQENPYGIEFTPVYQDETYVYLTVKKPLLPAPNSNDGNWSTKTTWGCKAYNDFQGTLAEGVGATPRLVSGDIALAGQWIGGRSTWNQKIHVPTTVTRLRAEVEARPYVQVVKVLSTVGTLTCQVPVGATRCEIELAWQPPPERDYYAWQIRLDNEAGEFYAYADYYYFYWDYVAPLIDTVTIDTAAKTARVNITDPHTTADWRNPWWQPQTVQLIATRRDGATVTLAPTATRNPTTHSYFYDFALSQLEEGQYTLTVRVVDTFNNERTRQWGDYEVDHTGPTVTLTVAPDDRPLRGEVTLEVLEDIHIRLSDAADSHPALTDISLSGGPQHDAVHLAWHQDQDVWYLEYPVMYPSLEVGDYQLKVTARDASGNVTVATAAFSYQPHRINLRGGNTLAVPVAERAFSHRDGAPALVSETVSLRDGNLLEGIYDVYGTMNRDGIPVVVNGVRLDPGQTVKVAAGYVLGPGRERLQLSLAALAAGQGQLLLTLPGAPRSPVVQADLHAWAAAARVATPASVRAILDPLALTAAAAAATPCALTTDPARARAGDVFTAPVCYLEWTALPDEGEAATGDPPTVTGQAVAVGAQRVAWRLTLIDGDGTVAPVGEGEQALTVVAPEVAVVPDSDRPLLLKVQPLWLSWRAEADACDLTVTEALARARAVKGQPTCLLRWQTLPAGVSQAADTPGPLLTGYLDDPSATTVGWQLSLFSRRGARLDLAPQQLTLATAAPPPPTLTVSGDAPVPGLTPAERLLTAPPGGGAVGTVRVEAPAGGLQLTVTTAGQAPAGSGVEPTRFSTRSRLAYLLRAPAGALWERRVFTLTAAYSRWPALSTTTTVTLLYVPAAQLRAELTAPAEQLDNQRLPVTLQVGRPAGDKLSYDAATMGDWTGVVAGRERGQAEAQAPPLTAVTPLTAGAATFTVDVAGRGDLTLTGTAQLRSPDGVYRRTLTTRPVYVSVLRAGGLSGRLVADRALTGAAPLKAAFSLQLERAMQDALGAVHWQVSHDDGAHWVALTDRADQRLVTVQLPVGRHQVQAQLTNRHTGAVSVTNTATVVAYAVPELAIVGPRAALVRGPVTLTARLTQNDQPLAGVIEWWQLDKPGSRQVGAGENYAFRADTPQKLTLEARARLADAPAGEPAAWVKARQVVEVLPPTPPTLRIEGPQYLELGNTYRLTALTLLPSPWLAPDDYPIQVQWTLPDGSTRTGATLLYAPTAADVAAGAARLRASAWIEGYQTAAAIRTVEHRASVRQYVWPNFVLETSQRLAAAPAAVELAVTAPKFTGQLDTPTYQWRWPAGVTPGRVSGPNASVVLPEPGRYPVAVTVADARGHQTPLETTLEAVAAEPFTLTLDLRPANAYRRAPLEVVVYPRVSGGHPKDRPVKYQFYLDGRAAGKDEVQDDSARFTGIAAGDHILRVELQSLLGVTASAQQPLAVVANQPPICTLHRTAGSRSLRVDAACRDPDGKVVGYRWTLDGETISVTTDRLTLDSRSHGQTVTVTARDDAGAETSASLTLP